MLINFELNLSHFLRCHTTESQFVLEALAWVNSQWAHDGINQPPKHFSALDILKKVHNEKEKYRCVEYGIVLSEVLQAYDVGHSGLREAPRAPYRGP